MTDSSFDILAGPQGIKQSRDVRADKRPIPVGGITILITIALTIGATAVVAMDEIALAPVVFVGGLVLSLVLGLVASWVVERSRRGKSWLETEVEISWFRALNAIKESDSDDIDWEIWESSFSRSPASESGVSEFERGYREGYRRGAIDAA